AHGCSFHEGGRPFIYINSLLSHPEQVIAGFHEFHHLTDHALNTDVFLSTGNLWNRSKYEYQAQVVGVLAYMPDPLVWGLSAEEIQSCFGVTRQLARFRASLGISTDWTLCAAVLSESE
ncbi:MAG: ImmA/IrrE family metallo-endopeptidase, partial [Blastocatellia bacterium]